MRFLLLCVALAGCTTSTPAPAPPKGAAAAATAAPDDCTLATPLVPGVPGSPGHFIKSAINPNGASELATLMRTLAEDWKATRAALDRGQKPAPLWPRHRKLRCAWPTDAADRNAAFDAMAQTYLAAVKALDSAPGPATYDSALKACRACHEVTCGGPLQLIDGLKRGP